MARATERTDLDDVRVAIFSQLIGQRLPQAHYSIVNGIFNSLQGSNISGSGRTRCTSCS